VSPSRAHVPLEPSPSDLCRFFAAGKRCKNCSSCRFFHDEAHPTAWRARAALQRRRAEGDMPQEIKPSDFGPGILRDRTTAVRAYLQKRGVDTQVLRGTELVFSPDNNVTPEWCRLLLTGCQEPTATAYRVVQRLKSIHNKSAYIEIEPGKPVQLTVDWSQNVPERLWHGTDDEGALGILKHRALRPSSRPPAVYSVRDEADLIQHGLEQNWRVAFSTVSLPPTHACAKLLSKEPVPGITITPKQANRSAPEWRVHAESIQLLHIDVKWRYMKALLEEWLSGQAYGLGKHSSEAGYRWRPKAR